MDFGPESPVYMIEFRNNCFHYTIDNELFDMISGGRSHPFEDRNEYQRCEKFVDVKKPKDSSLNSSGNILFLNPFLLLVLKLYH